MKEIDQRYKQWFNQSGNTYLVDELAKTFTEEAYKTIDCLTCAQCCLTTVTTFDDDDINKAAKWLSKSRKDFIKEYLIIDVDGVFTTASVPCPMLDVLTHKCKIYEVRPKACASFPHTQKNHFIRRKQAHLQNSRFCLITQQVLDKLIGDKE